MVVKLPWAAMILAAGLISLGFGFWTQTREKGNLSIIGSIFLPVGLVVALLGTLLMFVPAFFTG